MKQYFKRAAIFLIIILQVINIFFWGTQKEGFFGDELYSYEFVCQSDYPFISYDRDAAPYLNVWHTSDYYKDYLTITGDEKFDLKGVYDGLTADVHPPLFYMFLTIACSVLEGHFTKWAGIGVNIVFFILAILVLYKLMRELTESAVLRFAVPIIYGFSVGAVTTVIFIRMYTLLMFATVLFAYLHLRLWKQLDEAENRTKNICLHLSIALTTFLGFMTQYYFILVAFFFSVIWWGYLLLSKKYRQVVGYMVTMGGSLLCSFAFWPYLIQHIFFGYRGRQAFQSAAKGENDIQTMFTIISEQLFMKRGKLLLGLAVLLCIIAVLCQFIQIKIHIEKGNIACCMEKRNRCIALPIEFTLTAKQCFLIQTLIAVLLDVAVIATIAPYKTDRYLFNIYPLVIMLTAVAFVSLMKKITTNQRWQCGILVFLLAVTFASYGTTDVGYLYKGTREKMKTAQKYSDLPVVVLLTHDNLDFTTCSDTIYFIYGQMVYPTDEKGISTISEALDEIDCGDQFILYVDKKVKNIDDCINKVKKTTGADKSKRLYSTSRCVASLVSKTQGAKE